MRFAGSEVSFEFPGLQSAAGGSGAAAAADMVRIDNTFGTLAATRPRNDQLSASIMENNAALTSAGLKAEAMAYGTGMEILGQTSAAKAISEATKSAAKDKAEGMKSSALLGGIGKVASAALSLGVFSDETMKNDIKQIDTALEKLRNLRPVTFRYKEEFSSEPERLHHGFIAQEFQTVLPDATYYDESSGKLNIDLGDVIGLLVRANQELEERVGMLEAKQALATV